MNDTKLNEIMKFNNYNLEIWKNRIIYIDFDGVLVDTPRLIKEQIKIKGNSCETCQNFPWKIFLEKCNEIENNFSYIKKLSEKFKVIIITHVYSDNEQQEKQRYIRENLKGIECITVPYYIEKSEIVNPKENILIDDYSINIDKWIKSGGIGIHFKEEKRIDKLLKEYILI